ncbi:MAG: LysR substrate-binding domain-containing protein [Pseudomonadota bacterium]
MTSIAPRLLSGALPIIGQRLPKLELHLREDEAGTLLSKLESGLLDACILAEDISRDACVQHPLFQERYVLFAQNRFTSELGLSDKQITHDDLRKLELLLQCDSHCRPVKLDNLCHLADKRTFDHLGSVSLQTIICLVIGGNGATLAPELALDESCFASSVSILRLTPSFPTRKISLVSKRHMNPGLDLTELASIFCEVGTSILAANDSALDARNT